MYSINKYPVTEYTGGDFVHTVYSCDKCGACIAEILRDAQTREVKCFSSVMPRYFPRFCPFCGGELGDLFPFGLYGPERSEVW